MNYYRYYYHVCQVVNRNQSYFRFPNACLFYKWLLFPECIIVAQATFRFFLTKIAKKSVYMLTFCFEIIHCHYICPLSFRRIIVYKLFYLFVLCKIDDENPARNLCETQRIREALHSRASFRVSFFCIFRSLIILFIYFTCINEKEVLGRNARGSIESYKNTVILHVGADLLFCSSTEDM